MSEESQLAILIAVTNLKGGVGKSTISSILASKFMIKSGKKACVFNIAKGQSAESINEVETIDYSTLLEGDKTISVSDALAYMMDKYDYIFIDTAGDLSSELIEVINFIDYFIVPFDTGKRTYEDTMTYLNSIFASGIIDKKTHNISMVFNKFNNKADIVTVNDKYLQILTKLEEENHIKFNSNFTKLSNSNTVETMEDKKASIDTLVGTNAVAYGIFNQKAENMYLDIKKHMDAVLSER